MYRSTCHIVGGAHLPCGVHTPVGPALPPSCLQDGHGGVHHVGLRVGYTLVAPPAHRMFISVNLPPLLLWALPSLPPAYRMGIVGSTTCAHAVMPPTRSTPCVMPASLSRLTATCMRGGACINGCACMSSDRFVCTGTCMSRGSSQRRAPRFSPAHIPQLLHSRPPTCMHDGFAQACWCSMRMPRGSAQPIMPHARLDPAPPSVPGPCWFQSCKQPPHPGSPQTQGSIFMPPRAQAPA